MDFNLNGCIVEYRFAVKAMEREIEVSFPLLNTSVYDCVTNTDKGFKKIQIKSSSSTNEVARCYLYNTKKNFIRQKQLIILPFGSIHTMDFISLKIMAKCIH